MNNMIKKSDEELAEMVGAGNNKAFDEIERRYHSSIFGVIRRAIRSRDSAQDVYQEVLVRVLTVLRGGRYSGRGKLGGFLMTVARNIRTDLFRRKKRQALSSLETVETFAPDEATSNFYEKKQQEADLDVMTECIEGLDEKQRKAISLRLEGKSTKEIAATMNIPLNTALSYVDRAKKSLRKEFAKKRMVEDTVYD